MEAAIGQTLNLDIKIRPSNMCICPKIPGTEV
jgi:hypothetical protein